MNVLPNSLAARLLAVTAVWTVIALLVTGIVLTTLFRQNAEKNFNGILLAHTYNLMGAIDVDPDGNLEGEPNLGDPRFLTPLSGWYWSVARAKSPETVMLHSQSISGGNQQVASIQQMPFNDVFRRTYAVQSPSGDSVQRLEAQLSVGDGDELYQVMVGGNRDELEATIADFTNRLALFFLVFGLGTIAATYFVIRFGLRPLARASSALAEVRQGDASKIEGIYPTEVSPLVGEINALIEVNQQVVERARTQVGNLAHALKTPLAVISNEANHKKAKEFRLIGDQTRLMQNQVQTYLNRARIAAQAGVITARSPVKPGVETLVRVIGKLSPQLEFSTEVDDTLIFAGEEQDLQEIIGNLLENASHYAASRVHISAKSLTTESNQKPSLRIDVEDDGPGVSADLRSEILKRGKRLDETVPGTGLGLSIVSDIADEYGGRVELADSSMGGLKVAVILPRIAGKAR